MTPEQLLKPRYKVIADFPGTHYKMGEILESSETERFYNRYPHIFKRLEWWEERSEDEMPEYLKINQPERTSIAIVGNECEPEIQKVKKHWAQNLSGDFRYSLYDCFVSEWKSYSYSYGSFLPTTLKEYEAYKNQLTA